MTSRPLRVSAGDPVVIDSSVAFKWFDTAEEGADIAADLLSRGAAPGVLERAVRFLDDIDLAIYDAVFVALAVRFDAELVTADRRQARSNACRMRLVR